MRRTGTGKTLGIRIIHIKYLCPNWIFYLTFSSLQNRIWTTGCPSQVPHPATFFAWIFVLMAKFEGKPYGYPYRKSLIFGYFRGKIIRLPLSKIADILLNLKTKNVVLPLSKIIDFWLFLRKNHRVTSIENRWFLANLTKNHRVSHIENHWFLASLEKNHRFTLSKIADFWLNLKKNHKGTSIGKSLFLANLKKNHGIIPIENHWFLADFEKKNHRFTPIENRYNYTPRSHVLQVYTIYPNVACVGW